MDKKPSLTEVRRTQIVTPHGEGYTERDIAAELSCSKTAAPNAIVNNLLWLKTTSSFLSILDHSSLDFTRRHGLRLEDDNWAKSAKYSTSAKGTLYVLCHIQDITYRGLCVTMFGTLAGSKTISNRSTTRIRSDDPPHH